MTEMTKACDPEKVKRIWSKIVKLEKENANIDSKDWNIAKDIVEIIEDEAMSCY